MTRWRRLLWILQPCVIAVLVWTALGFPRRDLRVPLAFQNDALFYLAQAKTTIDTGWWYRTAALGAPSGHHAVLFPQSASVDQALVRVVGLRWPDVGAAMTVSWIVMLALGGVIAAWCLTRLGVSLGGAWAAGILFALAPYALYRNVAHFGLSPYLVPFAATSATVLATKDGLDWRWRGWQWLLAGNLLLGANAIYYAVFGGFFLVVGAIAGAIRFRRPATLVAGGTAIAVLALAATLNMVPTLVAWQREGRPEGVVHRVADAELYALKIRQLVTPVQGHWFPPFRSWGQHDADAGFPNETENVGSRLGIVATTGFLGLLAVLLVPSFASDDESGDTVRTAARLTLAAILLATLGGLGSVFSELVSPAIRSYTRITPFITFFALTAVALAIDRWRPRRPAVWTAVWAFVLVLGVADQLVGLWPVTTMVAQTASEYRRLRFFVGQLEQRLPADAMVFQLPLRPYPVDGGSARLGTYELFKPYLVSHSLRWSYPALSDAQVRQQARIAAIPAADLPAFLAGQGFAAILVDRLGYDDNGNGILAALQTVPMQALPIGQTERYVALDLRFARPPASR
jgi:hypothetical protein